MPRILAWPIAAVAALLTLGAVRAQDAIRDWPSRTVRIVIPLGAGGGGEAWRQKNFIDRAIEPAVGETEDFVRFVQQSRKRAAEIIKDAGIQPQ